MKKRLYAPFVKSSLAFALSSLLCAFFAISLFSPFAFSQFPWNNPLKIATSTNGTDFSLPTTFQDSSGVPCAIRLGGDTLLAVFQWFREPRNSPTWDRVAAKFSYNNGQTWTEPKPIVVEGLPSNYQRPFDPTIVATDSGIRIYYSSSNGMPMFGADSIIDTYSAFGTDGVHYTFEPGARFNAPSRKVIDPAVVFYHGTWHLASPIGAPQEGAYHGISDDGLTFAELADIPSDNRHNWTGNYVNDGDSILRFYGSGERIWLNTSADGTVWRGYIATNVQGGDPTVVQMADGSYVMIYVGQPYPTTVELENSRTREQFDSSDREVIYNSMGQIVSSCDASGLYFVVRWKGSQHFDTTLLFVP